MQSLVPGKMVCMKLPGKDRWSPGICIEKCGNRSYTVKVGETKYCQNRRHLLKMKESTLEPEETEKSSATPVENTQVETPVIPAHTAGPRDTVLMADNPSPGQHRSRCVCQAPEWQKLQTGVALHSAAITFYILFCLYII